jgi:hypothetical protein
MKEPLTLEQAIERRYTPIDCVKYYRPNWTNKQCDVYLWENTCYPMSNEILLEQLNKQLNN